MTRRRWLVAGLASAALLLIIGRVLAGWYVDYHWYAAQGASALWRARLGAEVALRVGSGLIAIAAIFINLYVVRHSVVALVLPRQVGDLEIGAEVPGHYLVGTAAGIAVLIGALLALPGDRWTTLLLARAPSVFGEADPYLQADLGFFVFWLPFETMLYEWALLVLGVSAALVVGLYALTPSLRVGRSGFYVSAYVRRHLTVLGGVLLLLLAWGYRLDMYHLLTTGTGPMGMFTWVDHQVGIPGLLLLSLVTLGAALVVLWAGVSDQPRLAFLAVTAVILLAVVVQALAPVVARRFAREPDATRREQPYEEIRAAYTRRALALDQLEAGDSTLRFATLADAARGAAIWDPPALRRASALTRAGESWLGWRARSIGPTASLVARAPVDGATPDGSWPAQQLFTAAATTAGGPIPLVRAGGLPLAVAAPVVYPGAGDYSLVADSVGNVAGSRLDSRLSRVAHAWALQNPHILVTELPSPRPTIVLERDLRARVRALAPFFAQGSDVSPAVVGDSLFWLLHLYAVSPDYPLAERVALDGGEWSYLQHAAVAVVQAQTGRVRLVPDRTLDPVAASWVAIFPSLFAPSQSLPPALAAALPPPEDAILAQASAFARLGTRSERAAPQRTALVDPLALGADDSTMARPLAPTAVDSTTLSATLPVLDAQDRVVGAVTGTGGARRRVAWLPLAEPGPAWESVLDRLQSAPGAPGEDPETLVRGPVHLLPLREGFAYVQSTYRWSAAAQRPAALVRVAVLLGDSVRVGPTLRQIAGLPAVPPELGGQTEPRDLAPLARELYETMRDAARRGDWSTFGQAFDSLGRVLGGRH